MISRREADESLAAQAIAVAEQRKGVCPYEFNLLKCKNMKCTYEGFDGERYRCEICGESCFLDYENMK